MTDLTLKLRDKAGHLSASKVVTINWTQPTSGLPLVGAAMQTSGTDPAPLEAFCGRPLGLNRTYWNLDASTVTSSIARAKADIAAGRLPWLSYKAGSHTDPSTGKPVQDTWPQMLAKTYNDYDAIIAKLAASLASLKVPVWVALHHEPEGDGNLPDWTKIQDTYLSVLAKAAPNVVPWIILTGYDTYYSGNAAYSVNALYPKTFKPNLGIDRYNNYGDAKHPVPPGAAWLEAKDWYDRIAPDAKRLGVDWAIAETGLTDPGATKDADWITRAYDDMANHPIQPGIGLAYFNSNANSVGTWPLGTGTKRTKFAAILNRSR